MFSVCASATTGTIDTRNVGGFTHTLKREEVEEEEGKEEEERGMGEKCVNGKLLISPGVYKNDRMKRKDMKSIRSRESSKNVLGS